MPQCGACGQRFGLWQEEKGYVPAPELDDDPLNNTEPEFWDTVRETCPICGTSRKESEALLRTSRRKSRRRTSAPEGPPDYPFPMSLIAYMVDSVGKLFKKY